MSDYKVGDKIVMTESANAVYGYTLQGAKGTIVSGPDRRGEYTVKFECSTLHNYHRDTGCAEYEVHPTHFTLNPAQPVFNKGDKVRVLRNRDDMFHAGDILTVDNPRIDSGGDITAEKDNGDWGWIGVDAIELVHDDSGAEIATLRAEVERLNDKITFDASTMRAMSNEIAAARSDANRWRESYVKLLETLDNDELIAMIIDGMR